MWLRIRLSVAAWTYEKYDHSIMSDADYDRMSLEVDPKITTGNRKLDKFFREQFDPSTGSWIHRHPELEKIDHIAKKHWLG